MLLTLDEFPCPINDSAPIEELPILKGLKCKECEFLSTSIAVMQKHIYSEKQKLHKENRVIYTRYIYPGTELVLLQT